MNNPEQSFTDSQQPLGLLVAPEYVHHTEARPLEDVVDELNTLTESQGREGLLLVNPGDDSWELLHDYYRANNERALQTENTRKPYGERLLERLEEIDNRYLGVAGAKEFGRRTSKREIRNRNSSLDELLFEPQRSLEISYIKRELLEAMVDRDQGLGSRVSNLIRTELLESVYSGHEVEFDTTTEELIEALDDDQLEVFIFYHYEKFLANSQEATESLPEIQQEFIEALSTYLSENNPGISLDEAIRRVQGVRIEFVDYLDRLREPMGTYSPGGHLISIDPSEKEILKHIYFHEAVHALSGDPRIWSSSKQAFGYSGSFYEAILEEEFAKFGHTPGEKEKYFFNLKEAITESLTRQLLGETDSPRVYAEEVTLFEDMTPEIRALLTSLSLTGEAISEDSEEFELISAAIKRAVVGYRAYKIALSELKNQN